MFLEKLLTGDIFCPDMTAVCQIWKPFHPLGEGQLTGGGETAVVDYNSVEFVFRLKGANLAEEFSAAFRGQIEYIGEGEGRKPAIYEPPPEVACPYCLRHHPQHIYVGTAGNIAGQSNLQTLLDIFVDWGDAGRKVCV